MKIVINKCPCCNGTGKVEMELRVKMKVTLAMRNRMKKLRKQGFSYRQISKVFKIKDPASIWYYVNH